MNPLGLTTTIVDLAPRLVLPFSPQYALWLEMTGALVVSCAAVVFAALRAAGLRRARRRQTRHPRAGRVVALRPELGGEIG